MVRWVEDEYSLILYTFSSPYNKKNKWGSISTTPIAYLLFFFASTKCAVKILTGKLLPSLS